MIIGLTGLARSGKDSFFNFAKNYLIKNDFKIKKYAFADALKKECEEFIYNNTGISVFTEDSYEKNLIRPTLVAYGTHLRRMIDPDCWIKKISKSVEEDEKNDHIIFITDVRYPNELEWIKSIGGSIIHISKEGNLCPNAEENNNDPILKKLSSFIFSWEPFDKNPNAEKSVHHFFEKNFKFKNESYN
jgi:hypothetical protein